MMTHSYSYVAPTDVEQLRKALRDGRSTHGRSQVLAGGTDLLVQMQSVDRAARAIVDIKKVPEANDVDISTTHVYIGAAVPAARLTAHEGLRNLFPGMIESVGLIGSTQIQQRATLGGNLCNASPAGDTIPAMMVNEGVCRIVTADGEREVEVARFVTGVQQNCLKPGECLLGVRFPRPGVRTADAYLRLIPRSEMDIAVAGAGISLMLDDTGRCSSARVAIGAVAATALLVPKAAAALVGSRLEAEALTEAAAAASAAARPITDKRGTVDYRRRVVGVLVRRAALRAAEILHERQEA